MPIFHLREEDRTRLVVPHPRVHLRVCNSVVPHPRVSLRVYNGGIRLPTMLGGVPTVVYMPPYHARRGYPGRCTSFLPCLGEVYPGCIPGYIPPYMHQGVYQVIYHPILPWVHHATTVRTPGYTVTLCHAARRRSPGLKDGIYPGWEASARLKPLFLLRLVGRLLRRLLALP